MFPDHAGPTRHVPAGCHPGATPGYGRPMEKPEAEGRPVPEESQEEPSDDRPAGIEEGLEPNDDGTLPVGG